MDAILRRMISSGSLAAFGSAALQGPTPIAGARPVQSAARAPTGQGGGSQPGGQGAVQPAPMQLQPGQILPRGSLLNLTV